MAQVGRCPNLTYNDPTVRLGTNGKAKQVEHATFVEVQTMRTMQSTMDGEVDSDGEAKQVEHTTFVEVQTMRLAAKSWNK